MQCPLLGLIWYLGPVRLLVALLVGLVLRLIGVDCLRQLLPLIGCGGFCWCFCMNFLPPLWGRHAILAVVEVGPVLKLALLECV